MWKPVERSHPARIVALIALGLAAAGGAFAAPGARALPQTPQDYLRRFDADGDGRIVRAEYVGYAMRGFDGMDRDGDGVLAGAELPFAESPPVSRERRVRALERVFQRLDVDGSGALDARELASPLR